MPETDTSGRHGPGQSNRGLVLRCCLRRPKRCKRRPSFARKLVSVTSVLERQSSACGDDAAVRRDLQRLGHRRIQLRRLRLVTFDTCLIADVTNAVCVLVRSPLGENVVTLGVANDPPVRRLDKCRRIYLERKSPFDATFDNLHILFNGGFVSLSILPLGQRISIESIFVARQRQESLAGRAMKDNCRRRSSTVRFDVPACHVITAPTAADYSSSRRAAVRSSCFVAALVAQQQRRLAIVRRKHVCIAIVIEIAERHAASGKHLGENSVPISRSRL